MYFLDHNDRQKLADLLNRKPPTSPKPSKVQDGRPSYLVNLPKPIGQNENGNMLTETANILAISSTGSTNGYHGSTTGQKVTICNPLTTPLSTGTYAVIRDPLSGDYVLAGANMSGAMISCPIIIQWPNGAIQNWTASGLVTSGQTTTVTDVNGNTPASGQLFVAWATAVGRKLDNQEVYL